MLGQFTKAHIGMILSTLAMFSVPMLGIELSADFQSAATVVISQLLVWFGVWAAPNAPAP